MKKRTKKESLKNSPFSRGELSDCHLPSNLGAGDNRFHRNLIGVCRTYASRLDFCPFSLLRRCQNTHVAQLRSVFVALHQEKIIKNRLEVLKSDRLPEDRSKIRRGLSLLE